MPARMKLTEINMIELLTQDKYQSVLAHFGQKRVSKKEIAYLPQNEENLVFLVRSGRLKIYLAYEDKEFTLGILEPGDIYTTHTRAFVQAMEDSEILTIRVEEFQRILSGFPQLSMIMVKVLGDLLKNSITIINGLVFNEIQVRLAEFLLQATEDKGINCNKGLQVKLGLTVEEIGKILGSSRQTVSMLLNDLVYSGIIEKGPKGYYTILDKSKLMNLANRGQTNL